MLTKDVGVFVEFKMFNYKSFPKVPKVDIQQVENKITCRSDGIYPEPKLTWSTNPPSNMTLQNKTEVQQTEQQLYNIISSLILSDSAGDLTYNCTVSTQTSSRRASLKTLHKYQLCKHTVYLLLCSSCSTFSFFRGNNKVTLH